MPMVPISRRNPEQNALKIKMEATQTLGRHLMNRSCERIRCSSCQFETNIRLIFGNHAVRLFCSPTFVPQKQLL